MTVAYNTGLPAGCDLEEGLGYVSHLPETDYQGNSLFTGYFFRMVFLPVLKPEG
jgi:hypothetical protein